MAFEIDLSTKTVLITGGVSGIGLGVSQAFARAGATVIACSELAVGDKQVKDYLQIVKEQGKEGYYYSIDLTQANEIIQLVQQIRQDGHTVDIIVSNAGKNVFSRISDCSPSDWDFNQKLNLEAHWLLGKAFKAMLASKGNGVLIVMASNHAYTSMPGCFPYNVAKAGLLAMVQAMAMEWAPSIRTIGIAPGFIDTPGNQKWFDSFENPDAKRQEVINLHPMKKLGTAEEIGGWCVFLASHYAAFANGTTYLIDGGRSALMQD